MPFKLLKKKFAKCNTLARLLRYKFTPIDFDPFESLYRGFRKIDLPDQLGELRANSFSFPNISCNWNRFSKPVDIRKRAGGLPTDGCYSFTVEQARYDG